LPLPPAAARDIPAEVARRCAATSVIIEYLRAAARRPGGGSTLAPSGTPVAGGRVRGEEAEMVPEINYWAVLLATLSSMLVGTIWYARRVFGTRWAKLANVDMDRPGASAVMPIVVTVIVSFVTAWVLAGASTIAWHFYGGGYLMAALFTALILWAGFTAARFITHDAFEGRPSTLTIINIAHELVTLIVMAIIIGVWPPAGTV
jgi:hypothetical protein